MIRIHAGPNTNTPLQRITPAGEDSPRYKAIGNSKTVTVVRWIGQRILRQITPSPYG